VTSKKTGFWTHPSVLAFADARDPITEIVERANALVLDAVEHGWKGPPFDTFELAQILGLAVMPRDSIRDARLVPIARNHFRIEYNPHQPPARIRFSIAHEISHTLFPDCRERVHTRAAQHHMVGDDWQLEMLCNVGAAELLMPLGSFPEIGEGDLSIDLLLRLREKFQVSAEAVLLRVVKLTRVPCAVFAASRESVGSASPSVDYLRSSRAWDVRLQSGFRLSSHSVVNECRAIGFTAKGNETWHETMGEMHIECVAVPPYPGKQEPRIVGIVSPLKPRPLSLPSIAYLIGDATEPRGNGHNIVAHIVNDATPRWGAGFARVVRDRWPEAQADFVAWTEEDRSRLRLGSHRLFRVDDELSLFHMVAQQGYGPSPRPRIRYRALDACLRGLVTVAIELSATLHMPRIGCGQAGGSWSIVAELIDQHLCRHGIAVTVYDPPSERSRWERSDRERTLFGSLEAE
jgi:Zn-dependent peptidase ImmA (M78 family)